MLVHKFLIFFKDSMKFKTIFCGKNDNISQSKENIILKYTEVLYQNETWLDVDTGIFTAPTDGKNFYAYIYYFYIFKISRQFSNNFQNLPPS